MIKYFRPVYCSMSFTVKFGSGSNKIVKAMLDEVLLQERLHHFNPKPLIENNELKIKENIESYMIKENEHNIDLAKANFLGLLDSDEIKQSSENIIRKYGVGTCGPRAFYGTTDIHLKLEEALAQFMGMEEGIVYSYGFVAISSSIAAYCKRNDVVFVDKEHNFPIQQGLTAARCNVKYFDHNNPNSFREEVEKVINSEKNKKPTRKFVLVEGISWKTGKLLPLPEFLKVAEDYKIRIFLDETYSIGIFGDKGKGLTEHFNIEPNRIDMIMGTLEAAIGSIGGFCVGSQLTIDHQRLSGSGYIFSASQPTFLVQACLESLQLIQDKPRKLRSLAQEVHLFLKESCKFTVKSDPECPFQVFSADQERNSKIHTFCKRNGVHFIKTENDLVLNLNVDLFNNKIKLDKVYKYLEIASTL